LWWDKSVKDKYKQQLVAASNSVGRVGAATLKRGPTPSENNGNKKVLDSCGNKGPNLPWGRKSCFTDGKRGGKKV